MDARQHLYYQLNTALSYCSDEQLSQLINKVERENGWGWGASQTVEFHGTKIFVKRVPVTELEYRNLYSTRNLFDLPVYYNYGVGSAGFGVFREIAMHAKTTNWVLTRRCVNFPLTYRVRILPAAGARPGVNREQLERYVQSWNSNAHIRRYISERFNAQHEAVIFLEHFPQTLAQLIQNSMDSLNAMIEQTRETLEFLHEQGVCHLDAHFWNILTDGQRPYLTDFGLVQDKSFELSLAEKRFMQRHTQYDLGILLGCLEWYLPAYFESLTARRKRALAVQYGITPEMPFPELQRCLLQNLEAINKEGQMKLPPAYVELLLRYRPIIRLVNDFLDIMRRNPRKNTRFRHAQLKNLLENAQ